MAKNMEKKRRFVAFLRAINVGGHVVSMAELRALFEDLGFEDLETFISSGNVVFSSPSKNPAALEKRIEDRLAAALGYEVKTFLRTEGEVSAVAGCKPFTAVRMVFGRLVKARTTFRGMNTMTRLAAKLTGPSGVEQ